MLLSNRLYPKLILTMLFWGGTWITGRVAVQEINPLLVAVYRFGLASICLGYLVYRHYRCIPLPSYKQLFIVILCTLTGIVAYNLFFFYGLKFIAAGRGALVIALNPVVAAIFAWLLFREPMPVRRVLGIITALLGCIFVISNGHPLALFSGEIGIGEWLILCCVICWTLYTFLGHEAKNLGLSPLLVTFYASSIGFLFFILLAWAAGQLFLPPVYSLKAWASVIFLGMFGTTIAFTWFTEAVRHIGPAKASAFLNLVPIFAVSLGILLLGETLNFMTSVGGGLVLLGVFFTVRDQAPKAISSKM